MARIVLSLALYFTRKHGGHRRHVYLDGLLDTLLSWERLRHAGDSCVLFVDSTVTDSDIGRRVLRVLRARFAYVDVRRVDDKGRQWPCYAKAGYRVLALLDRSPGDVVMMRDVDSPISAADVSRVRAWAADPNAAPVLSYKPGSWPYLGMGLTTIRVGVVVGPVSDYLDWLGRPDEHRRIRALYERSLGCEDDPRGRGLDETFLTWCFGSYPRDVVAVTRDDKGSYFDTKTGEPIVPFVYHGRRRWPKAADVYRRWWQYTGVNS